MTNDLPIACTLSGDELAARLRDIADLGRDALTESRLDGRQARLRFSAAPGIRERVDAIAAAESRCCAFLDFRVAGEDGTVVLSIGAPEGAEPVLAELVA